MFTLKNYVKPASVAEAYELIKKRSNVVLGGMLWLKMSEKNYNTAIDLSDVVSDKKEKKDGFYHIGAYAALRQLEKDPELNLMTGNAFSDALKDIVGVQFRNSATLGGSIWGRYGFSDILTLLSVLDARVALYKNGTISLDEFIKLKRSERDILSEIIIPDKKVSCAFTCMRNSATDFSVLNCAVNLSGEKACCAVGARPSCARLIYDEENILETVNEESAEKFAQYVKDRLNFGSNMRAEALYREKICPVLIKRAVFKAVEK